ncbi:hypothetical protein [Plasmodium yoelii yoelii]|uniref:Uncharacterized protein n=1 Tax=Plasmodium yoelii yoelii TaxID=73239 RepID=Q7RFQ0_PLAYO|nr:hypothetical protein [Plasmodium yoelii yoelii]
MRYRCRSKNNPLIIMQMPEFTDAPFNKIGVKAWLQ